MEKEIRKYFSEDSKKKTLEKEIRKYFSEDSKKENDSSAAEQCEDCL